MARNFRTPEQKEALVTKIDELRKSGLSIEKGCDQLGIASSQYNKWKAKRYGVKASRKPYTRKAPAILAMTPAQMRPVSAPVASSMALVMGTPSQLAEFLTYRNQ